jgi:hypothetical protein
MEWRNSLDRFRQIPANECDACMEKGHELAISEEEQLSGKAG